MALGGGALGGANGPFVFNFQQAGQSTSTVPDPTLGYGPGLASNAAKKAPAFQVRFLPNDALACNAMGHDFYAPPKFSIKTIVKAGQAGGMFNVSAMNSAVGQFGTFDFQRVRDTTGNTTFYSGYTPVSNIAVGAYLYGADFTKNGASIIANTFALFKSSNKGDPRQSLFRNLGFDMAAGKGSASCSAIPK